MPAIEFFAQDISFKVPKPRKIKSWIKQVIQQERKQLTRLNYIFCSDKYLLSVNEQYLNHKTLTDIITFDNSEKPGYIEGDIFISVERVRANAESLDESFDRELQRVMIHGVLHLVGFNDKTTRQKSAMRKKEDTCLSLLRKL